MMKMLKKIILSVVLLQKVFSGYCQNEAQQQRELKYSPKQLQEDYQVFRKALETIYPSLYRFSDSLIITKYFEDQFLSINSPQTEAEFYKTIVSACARVNDEHLIPTPSKQYYLSLKEAAHYFPFSLKIIDRRFYVLQSACSNRLIPRGSEIITIDGKPVEEILNTLLPTIPSDGYIQTFNIRHLEDYSMTQNENLFDLNYPIFVENINSYTIEYVDVTDKSKKKITTIPGLDFKTYKEFYQQRLNYKAPLEFKYLKKMLLTCVSLLF